MSAAEPQWLTTGQAAKLCEVKPDTVLKWIKKGRLEPRRTAGGHYRIERRLVERLAPGMPQPIRPAAEAVPPLAHPLRCWEYLSQGGAVRDECKKCVVYGARAAWCFQLAGLNRDIGHARCFCATSCQECVYYRRVQGLATNVLVITSDKDLMARLVGEENESVTLRFARNGYEASGILGDFRPAFVVVDQELAQGGVAELLECLACDPRIAGVKIILGVPPGIVTSGKGRRRPEAVVGILEKPFGRRRIAAVINSFPVESLALANAG